MHHDLQMRCRAHHTQMRVDDTIPHGTLKMQRYRALEVVHELCKFNERGRLPDVARRCTLPVLAEDESRGVAGVVPRLETDMESLHAREQHTGFDVEDEGVGLIGRVTDENVNVLRYLSFLRRDRPLI